MSAEKKPDRPADQHKSRFMVRLPPEFQAIFAEARRRFRRTNVEEVRIALEKHFGELGMWPPKE